MSVTIFGGKKVIDNKMSVTIFCTASVLNMSGHGKGKGKGNVYLVRGHEGSEVE